MNSTGGSEDLLLSPHNGRGHAGGPPSSAPLKVSEPARRTNCNSAKEEAEGARAASSAVISGSDAGGWRMIRVGVAGAGASADGACSLGVVRLIPRNLREERGDSSAFAADTGAADGEGIDGIASRLMPAPRKGEGIAAEFLWQALDATLDFSMFVRFS